MKIELNLGSTAPIAADVVILATFSKKEKKEKKKSPFPRLLDFRSLAKNRCSLSLVHKILQEIRALNTLLIGKAKEFSF